MTAENPQVPRTIDDLRDELLRLECVDDVTVQNSDEIEWRKPWLRAVIDDVMVPPELCKELGRTHFGIMGFATQGYEFGIVEITEVSR